MAKVKLILEEGMLFSIKLNDNAWTLGQLCNLFKLEGKRYEQYTFTFFNHLYLSEEDLKSKIDAIDLSKPIIILTINGHPIKNYGLDLIGKREISYSNIPNYKDEISMSLGLYRNKSEDFDHILNAFFGLHPWDGFYKDDYVDNVLTSGTSRRDDVKYLKDFSLDELKKILPPNSVKLKQLIDSE